MDAIYTVLPRVLHPEQMIGLKVKDVSGACNKCGPRAIAIVVFGTVDEFKLVEDLARDAMQESQDIAVSLNPGKLFRCCFILCDNSLDVTDDEMCDSLHSLASPNNPFGDAFMAACAHVLIYMPSSILLV